VKAWKILATLGLFAVWPIAVFIDLLSGGTAAETVSRALRDLWQRPTPGTGERGSIPP
jgi:hypothetical protein